MIEEKLKRVEFTYNDLIEKLNQNEPFAFSRFGDGEFLCMMNPSETDGNCDGHIYYPSLSNALLSVLKSKPKYHLGIQNHAIKNHGAEIESLFDKHDLWENKFSDSDILHRASINNELDKLISALKDKDIVLIAPEYLSGIFKNQQIFHIIIPQKNCWLKKNAIQDTCVFTLDTTSHQVFLFCASMMSKVLIDYMYNHFPQHTYIDLGSVLDPYVGKSTRSYHKKIVERING